MSQDKATAAAARLEELSTVMSQMVTDLREGKPHPYARVYWLRREIGRVVATLGADVPPSIGQVDMEYNLLIPRDESARIDPGEPEQALNLNLAAPGELWPPLVVGQTEIDADPYR
jgi:hypothetical protein